MKVARNIEQIGCFTNKCVYEMKRANKRRANTVIIIDSFTLVCSLYLTKHDSLQYFGQFISLCLRMQGGCKVNGIRFEL